MEARRCKRMQCLKNDMWSVLRMPVKSQASAFWTSCSQGNSDRPDLKSQDSKNLKLWNLFTFVSSLIWRKKTPKQTSFNNSIYLLPQKTRLSKLTNTNSVLISGSILLWSHTSSGHVHFHPSSFVGKFSLSSVFGDAYAESLYTLDLLNKPYRKVSKDTGMLGSANLMPYTVIKDIYQNKTKEETKTHI